MAQITYCGNVHPTRCFEDVLRHLKGPCREVARELEKDSKSFPLGLWIPRSALQEAREKVHTFKSDLEGNGLSVATFNAFPMDIFHGQSVKEKVYQPDWSDKERLDYTISIAELAVALELEDVSISTVSGGYRPNDREEKIKSYIEHWLTFVDWARAEEERSGTCIRLALEPEPFNTLEDHRDALVLWPRLRKEAERRNLGSEVLDRHIGLCFDTCHFSVRFVEPLSAWKSLEEARIPVHKVQVSVAPRGEGVEGLKSLLEMDEPVYLHQTYHRDQQGTLREYLDLTEIGPDVDPEGEWRTHFHVPIHWGDRKETTGHELLPLLQYLGTLKKCPVLEVETYSFDALPGDTRKDSLVTSITKELRWCEEALKS